MTADQDKRPIVVSGPSGVGKGTLVTKLLNNHPDVFAATVSHTTRLPRPGEVEGQPYHFVSISEFESLISNDAFVEHTLFSGNYYGTSKQTVRDQQNKGKIPVLEIEMNGIMNIKKDQSLDVRCMFISPPSLQALEERLNRRGTESAEVVQRRLAQARVEMEYAKRPGVHDLVIINDDLDKAYGELEEWVLRGGRKLGI